MPSHIRDDDVDIDVAVGQGVPDIVITARGAPGPLQLRDRQRFVQLAIGAVVRGSGQRDRDGRGRGRGRGVFRAAATGNSEREGGDEQGPMLHMDSFQGRESGDLGFGEEYVAREPRDRRPPRI